MYEKEWRNAEEHEAEDNDQLEQRKKEKCFIADVPKSQHMPLVLPSKDEPQFRRLLSKKARKSEASTSQESYEPQKMEVDELMDKTNVKREVLAEQSDADIGITPTIRRSVAAGVTLKTLVADKDSSLMLFQLPTSLSAKSDAVKSNDISDQSTSQAGTSKQSLTGHKMQDKEAQRHCLDGFPTGVEIGKLQLLRSGRVIMKIGDQILDVAEAIPSQCYETAVRIETQPAESESNGANRSDFLSRVPNGFQVSNSAPPTNSIQVLGEIPYSFCASIDYSSRSRSKPKNNS